MTSYIDVFIEGESVTIRDYRRIWPSREVLLESLLDAFKDGCNGEVTMTDSSNTQAEFEIVED